MRCWLTSPRLVTGRYVTRTWTRLQRIGGAAGAVPHVVPLPLSTMVVTRW